MRHIIIAGLLATSFLAACSPANNSSSGMDESQEGFFIAGNIAGVDTTALSPAEQDLYRHAGLTMLVEQYNAVNLPTMRAAIAANPPAGIVFWNPEGVGAQELSAITRAYAASARNASQPPLLFSTDYEGGGLTKTISGRTVPGIQRFRRGFTLLPHGQWLGREIEQTDSDEICALQGEIMGQELLAAGINYPLATVSDLAGTLFTNRGISSNAAVVTRCMNTLLENFNRVSQGKSIFVTKHFPGLGFTRGDTHEITVLSDRRGAEFERHISPYRGILSNVRSRSQEGLLSIMVGHAQFTAYSPNRTSTESSYMLSRILKGTGQFEEQDNGAKYPRPALGFSGFVLSDAMWMGVYGFVNDMALYGRIRPLGNSETQIADAQRKTGQVRQYVMNQGLFTAAQVPTLGREDYQRVYNVMSLNSLLAGMDLLMIPNAQFARVVEFLRKGVVNRWDAEELRLIRVRTGLNQQQAVAQLKQRLTAIIAKNRSLRAGLHSPTEALTSNPSVESASLNTRLRSALSAIGFD